MRLGVVVGAPAGGSYEAQGTRAARLGFGAFCPWYDPARAIAELPGVRAALDQQGIEPVILNAYTNLVHPDAAVRAANVARMQDALRAARALGCRWVNTMAGTRDPELTFWAYHPDNFGAAAWHCLMESVQQVLDGVPEPDVGLTLEPYMLTTLSSAEELARAVREIDSSRLRLVLDPVNIIPPADYHRSDEALRHMFGMLGSWIIAAHAKDHYLHRAHATVQIDERVPGQGELPYDTFVRCMDALPDATLVIEHLGEDADILSAKDYIVAVAARAGILL